MKHKFYREENKWYIHLPEWKGDKEELEMILGADQMLDELSNYEDKITLEINVESSQHDVVILEKIEEDFAGATYMCAAFDYPIWLCSVTKHLFGVYPDKIYIQ